MNNRPVDEKLIARDKNSALGPCCFISVKRAMTVLLVAVFCFGGVSSALKVGGLEFSDSYGVDQFNLPLRGAGLKKFLSIRVVAVGLYLPEGVDSKDVLTDIPKSLEVIYLQNIPGIELQRATTKGIRLNVSKEEFAALEERIEAINEYYPDVRKQDRIRVTYVPGRGTIVELNGVLQGVVSGADFGKAFFAIWVGESPVDTRMKSVLLGLTKQKAAELND